MKYALAVLSHGDNWSLRAATVDRFKRRITPYPSIVIRHHDEDSEGFCKATARLWAKCAEADVNFVFWLEHDFLIERRFNLAPLAALLIEKPELAQVALVRNAVNEREENAGGIIDVHPRSDYVHVVRDNHQWLEHRINFTTNPSLMRRQFMEENPWPDYSSECEGKFSADFLARGYHFAYWGDGTPWVTHVGPMRTGHSY